LPYGRMAGVGVSVAVGVIVGVGVSVTVGVIVGVGVTVRVGVIVGVTVMVGVGVIVGVGPPTSTRCASAPRPSPSDCPDHTTNASPDGPMATFATLFSTV